MEHEELYDQICKILTWYEHPEEYGDDKDTMLAEMYDTLVRVQNEIFS